MEWISLLPSDYMIMFFNSFSTIPFLFQLFSIIVFGCISAGGWYAGDCIYNKDSNACNYGMGIGVIAFIGCIVFLVVDALFDNMSSVQHRKYAVIGDMGFSGEFHSIKSMSFAFIGPRHSTRGQTIFIVSLCLTT